MTKTRIYFGNLKFHQKSACSGGGCCMDSFLPDKCVGYFNDHK